MENDTFKIRFTKGNKDNSLPCHWDICFSDSDDSLFTVWTRLQDAELIVLALDGPAIRSHLASEGVARE